MKTYEYLNVPEINVAWSIYKGQTRVKEDFCTAQVWCFLKHENLLYPIACHTENGVIYCRISNGLLRPGIYSIKAIWVKDGRASYDIETLMAQGKRCYSEVSDLFCVTTDECKHDDNHIIIESNVATYGYDGLSAYEKSYMLGKTTLTEEEWLDSKNDVTLLIAGVKAEMRELLGKQHKAMTQAEYDELAYVDNETVYFIIGEDDGYEAIYFAGRKFEGGSKGPKEIEPEYDAPIVTMAYGTAGSNAGTLTPTVTIKQKWRKKYDNGTAAEQTELVYNLGSLPEGAEHSFSLSSTHADGVSVNAETGELAYGKATSTSQQTIATVVLSVTVNGKTGTASKGIVQSGGTDRKINTIYGAMTISVLTYSTAAASGGTITPGKVSYSIPVTEVWELAGQKQGTPVTSGATLAYEFVGSHDGATIDNAGKITWSENTSTTSERTVTVKVTATYTPEGGEAISNSTTAVAKQSKKVVSILCYVGQSNFGSVRTWKNTFKSKTASEIATILSTSKPMDTSKLITLDLSSSHMVAAYPSGYNISEMQYSDSGTVTTVNDYETYGSPVTIADVDYTVVAFFASSGTVGGIKFTKE